MSSTDPSRDRVEELLARAERVVHQPVPSRTPLNRLRWPLVGVGTIVAIVVVAAIATAGGGVGSSATTAVPLASTTSAVATTIPIVITLPPNTSGPTPRTTAFGVPARTITSQGGSLVLQGEVADQATADAIRLALADSFGADAIVDQLRVVVDAPFTDADPLSAGTAVRFPAGQPTTDLASLHFLNQLADLLVRHPGMTADIHVPADAGGDALARQRADVIRQYLAAQGVAADRMTSAGEPAAGQATQLTVILHHLPG
jgi:outer membrane protein OmpA-like peptidoglycan-associated protein